MNSIALPHLIYGATKPVTRESYRELYLHDMTRSARSSSSVTITWSAPASRRNGFLSAPRVVAMAVAPLSPLLANVVLDGLDKRLESRQLRFARYADDFTICVK